MPKNADNVGISLEAETGVLSAMLVDGARVMPVVMLSLKDSDFSDVRHRVLFKAMCDIYDEIHEIDLITAIHGVEERGLLNIVDKAYINAISDMVLSGHNVLNHINIVLKESQIRETIMTCNQAIGACNGCETSVGEIVGDTIKKLHNVITRTESKSLHVFSDVSITTEQQLDEFVLPDSEPKGVSTGFTVLDAQIGKLKPGQLIIIAAKTGMGKSTFAGNICFHNTFFAGKTVILFSLEMSGEEIAMRFIGSSANLPMATIVRMRSTSIEMIEQAKTGLKQIRNIPLYIDDKMAVTPMAITAKSQLLASTVGKVDLIVVDYLQLMLAGCKTNSRNEELSIITRSLKMLARELECPVIALSQMNRASDGRGDKSPMLSDLRDSGAIEQDADMVIFINRPEYYKRMHAPNDFGIDEVAEVIVAKNRNGTNCKVVLTFRPEYSRFEDYNQ